MLLKKEEADLLKCHRNFDPAELGEIISLGIHVDMVKEVLSKGSLLITDFGIFGELGGMYSLADFNAFEEGDGKLTEKDAFSFEMTDMVTGAMDSPPGSRDYEYPREKREMIKINQRAILQFFNIRVIVYPERVEIKGTIPTQILDKINKERKEGLRPS